MAKQSLAGRDEHADWADRFDSGSFHVESHVAGAMAAAHWHDHVELNLLLEGRMSYLFQGRRETVEARRLALFWAAIPHRAIEVVSGSRLICLYIPFQDFMALPIAGSLRKAVMHGAFLRAARIDPADTAAFQRWVDEWPGAGSARQRLILDEACLRVRRLALDPLETSDSARRDGTGERREGRSPSLDHAERMIEIINLRFGEELSIAAIAAELGTHQTTATSAFRRILGMSINEYIIRFRLSRALHLLADTNQPILDVAYACGFGSASRFYEVFKNRTGVTPRQFRSQLSPR